MIENVLMDLVTAINRLSEAVASAPSGQPASPPEAKPSKGAEPSKPSKPSKPAEVPEASVVVQAGMALNRAVGGAEAREILASIYEACGIEPCKISQVPEDKRACVLKALQEAMP